VGGWRTTDWLSLEIRKEVEQRSLIFTFLSGAERGAEKKKKKIKVSD
jgi:hypothetical protein